MDYILTKKILQSLESRKVEYLVFGAVALNLLGLARNTNDLDLFVAPDRDNIERLNSALRDVFHDPHIEEISAEELAGDYPAVQYVPPEGFPIDILTRLGEAFRFEDLESQRQDFEGVEVSVATPRTLYRMKKDEVRLEDRADAEILKLRFGLED
jgi:hypothetical protein